MRNPLPLGLLSLVLAACSANAPAYRPGAPGQWGGDDARAGHPWQPPPAATAQTPAPAPFQPPNLIGGAVAAVNILLGSLPPSPFPTPWPGTSAPPSTSGNSFEDEVLRLTNERRAAGAVCGGQPMPPVGPVTANATLRASARAHSADMARRNYFSHTTPEGAGPAERAVGAGYQGRMVGENIAAGQADPARVVQAWIDSTGHCENLMDRRYRVLGVGYVFDGDPSDRYAHYWTQNFGG